MFRRVRGRTLPDWAAEFDCASWAQLFLKYIIADPAVTCVIPATASPTIWRTISRPASAACPMRSSANRSGSSGRRCKGSSARTPAVLIAATAANSCSISARQIAGDEDQPRAAVAVGPVLEFDRPVRDMLHGMDDDRPAASLDRDEALDAQQVGSAQRGQHRHRLLEHRPGQRLRRRISEKLSIPCEWACAWSCVMRRQRAPAGRAPRRAERRARSRRRWRPRPAPR